MRLVKRKLYIHTESCNITVRWRIHILHSKVDITYEQIVQELEKKFQENKTSSDTNQHQLNQYTDSSAKDPLFSMVENIDRTTTTPSQMYYFKKQKLKKSFTPPYLRDPARRANMLGILLLILGIIIVFLPFTAALKTGFTLVLIGVFFIGFITEKSILRLIDRFRVKNMVTPPHQTITTSEKITLSIVIWIILSAFFTGSTNLDTFIILILIGILIIRTLTDEVITPVLRARMNLFIFFFLLGFIYIVTNRFIT